MSLRGGVAAGALFFAGLAAGDLHAAPPAKGTAPASALVALRAAPVFGADASTGEGWTEVVVTVDDPVAAPVKGTVEVQSSYFSYSADSRFLARAPFYVEARSTALLHVPVRAAAYAGTSLTVTALDDGGHKLGETTVSLGATSAPLLVDVDEPSRLSVVMRGWPMTLAWHPASSPYVSPGSAMNLTVGAPALDPHTGEPVLPERTAGYAPATVVLFPSEQLARLQGPDLDALVGWVLSGGTLAVFPTRPEDLRAGTLPTLVGGAVTTAPAPAMMMTLPGVIRGASPPLVLPPTPMPWGPAPPTAPTPAPTPTTGPGGATPIGYYVPVRTTPYAAGAGVGPSAALRGKVTGFTGGNLAPSAYGATASYGLGAVHVLGFDPTSAPALDDAWAHARILDMVEEAWDLRARRVFSPGAGERASDPYEVHRALDPNENFRPALGIAAILLVLYSILAGPVVFLRSRKRARPLDPLVWVPVASATCFALILVVGLAGKGWSGRARHLSLVEAGAGMTRGAAKRYRGFFASQTRAMRVRASEPGSVLMVMNTDTRSNTAPPALKLDKDGASLEDLTSLPWQTVVVAEDGFADLGGGISVRSKPDGSVVVANRTMRELHDALVWAPKSGATFFPTIAAGDTVLSTSGRSVFTPSGRRTVTAGSVTVHELDPSRFGVLLGKAGDEMGPLWTAITAASGSSTDWWPDDAPVVLGELRGGDVATSDSGLRVESDVTLVRVLGEGGAT